MFKHQQRTVLVGLLLFYKLVYNRLNQDPEPKLFDHDPEPIIFARNRLGNITVKAADKRLDTDAIQNKQN